MSVWGSIASILGRVAIQDRGERIDAALLWQGIATGGDFFCTERKEGKPLQRLHNDCVAGKCQFFEAARGYEPGVRQAKIVGLLSK